MEEPRGVRSIERHKRSAVDLVLHEIRRSILSGALTPGDQFVVQTLTAQLGVSHVPVREALRQLEAQGLVTLSPSRSAVVTALDPADLSSIYRMRRWIEPELAALSVAERGPVDLARIEVELSETFRRPITEDHWDHHQELHRLLVMPAAGPWELRVLNLLWDASERFTRLAFDPIGAPESQLQQHHDRHLALLAAAQSRNPDAMRNELRRHLDENEEVARECLMRIESFDGDSRKAAT